MKALCVLALAVVLPCAVLAKGYRNGYTGVDLASLPESELSHNHKPATRLNLNVLPKEWTWASVGPHNRNMLTTSLNQHIPRYCGSCYAHGTLSMINDRLKIRKKAMGPDVMLARQTLLNCAPFHNLSAGCDGGDIIDVLRYMREFGLPDETCQIYSATDYTKWPGAKECPPEAICQNCMPIDGKDTCWPVKTPVIYKLESYGKVENADEAGMMSEIYERGPIVCSIATPDDFTYGYRGEIYVEKDKSTPEDVDHDVEVVGWGEEAEKKFWIVRNRCGALCGTHHILCCGLKPHHQTSPFVNWGSFWGNLSFFKLERGTNALQIEAGDCWSAEPEFKMEDEVRDGELHGSMYGLIDDNKLQAKFEGASTRDERLGGALKPLRQATMATAA